MIPFDLSPDLIHTWFIDFDGTIAKHNGLFNDGYDTLLPGVKELWKKIPYDDKIIIVTARRSMWYSEIKKFMKDNYLRYDIILCDMPQGERIMINDIKPRGLNTSISWNVKRDEGFK